MAVNALYYGDLVKNPDKLVRFITGFRSLERGYCIVCGGPAMFIKSGNNLRETYICVNCRSNSRNRHIAKVLCDIYHVAKPYSMQKLTRSLPHLNVYEAQAGGPLHYKLESLDNYVCSEYFYNVPPGTLSGDGTRCEDLQHLSFEDGSFDLVITQDVFEHVRKPGLAWQEVWRVLKPGGYHVFTVPWYKDSRTVTRVETEQDRDVFILPVEYHGDSVRDGLVYSNFGYDLLEYLDTNGFSSMCISSTVSDGASYHIHDSCTFVARKKERPALFRGFESGHNSAPGKKTAAIEMAMAGR
jgi:SAM-dependent methyltransferase